MTIKEYCEIGVSFGVFMGGSAGLINSLTKVWTLAKKNTTSDTKTQTQAATSSDLTHFWMINRFLLGMIFIQLIGLSWFLVYSESLTTRSATIICLLSVSVGISALVSIILFLMFKMGILKYE